MLSTFFLLALTTAGLPPTPAADTLRTPGGVQYVFRTPGQGAPAGRRAVVRVHYTGFLPNGKYFDTSATDPRPLRVRLGRGEVIPGWDELLPLLPQGARVWARIPARLAYGAQGQRNPDNTTQYIIPPNTDLLFELEIVRVN